MDKTQKQIHEQNPGMHPSLIFSWLHSGVLFMGVLQGFSHPEFCSWMYSGVLSVDVLLGFVRGCAPGVCPWMCSSVFSQAAAAMHL